MLDPSKLELPKFSPDELLGRTFVREMEDDKKFRAIVVQKILDSDAENHKDLKFLVEIGEGGYDEIISYGELSQLIEDMVERESDPDHHYAYKGIIAHQGPLQSSHNNYKGSRYNVLILWEDGSETYEPLDIFKKDDPLECARYAEENGLLDTPGWKSLKHIAKNKHKLARLVNKAKTTGPVYQFGIRVPRYMMHKNDKQEDKTVSEDQRI